MNGGFERWRLRDFAPGAGEALRAFAQECDDGEWIDVSVPGDIHQALIAAGRIVARTDHYLAVRSDSAQFQANRHFFAALKDLWRQVSAPDIRISQRTGNELRVEGHARAYLFYFHITVPEAVARYSDNYFDLEPGERRTVSVTVLEAHLTPGMLSFSWR